MCFPYQRVLIIGSPGSGKSTLARRLHTRIGLPLVHLDMLYWQADKTTRTKEAFHALLRDALTGDRWIIDGNYSGTLEMRLSRADLVIFMDIPAEKCLDGVRKRRFQQRPDMPWIETEEDAAFMEYIRTFPEDKKPKLLSVLAAFPHIPVIMLRSHAEADAFLEKQA